MIEFYLQGLKINISTTDQQIAEYLTSYFHFLLHPKCKKTFDQIYVTINSGQEIAEPYIWNPTVSGRKFLLEGGRKFVQTEVDPEKRTIIINIESIKGLPLEIIMNFIFSGPLLFALMYWGLYFIHAACAALDAERGVLIVGDSGVGKTTLVLSLLKQGYYYLGEESPLLSKSTGSLELYSYPTDIRLNEESFALFPELKSLCKEMICPCIKHHISPDKVYKGLHLDTCRPRLLIFPQYQEESLGEFEEISRMDAMIDLSDRELIFFEDKEADRYTKEFSAILAELVNQTRSFRLRYSNKSLENVSRQITGILRETGR